MPNPLLPNPLLPNPLLPRTDLTQACAAALESSASRAWGLVTRRGTYCLVDGPPLEFPEDLLGFRAPRSWAGAVVAFRGRATSLDTGVDTAVRFGFALDRHGRTAAIVTNRDGTPHPLGDAQPVGHVPDVCLRIFGLPTPPEPTPPVLLCILDWIEELIGLSVDPEMSGWTSDWNAVADLHPLAQTSPDLSPRGLGRAARDDRISWDDLWKCAIDHRLAVGTLSADDLAWLDAGSMARFLLLGRPSLSSVLDAAAATLPDLVFRQILAAVEASQLTPRLPSR
jgi:hypothetical protein